MIFRLSQNLSAKIQVKGSKVLPLDDNPYADWTCRLFTADRTQYILLSNTRSQYSAILYAKGITCDSQFINRALDTIRDAMQHDGQQFAFRRWIAPASGTVQFSKSLNRSVTGSMYELIVHAIGWLTEGDLSPFDVALKLNEVLISSLPSPDGRGYGKPRGRRSRRCSPLPVLLEELDDPFLQRPHGFIQRLGLSAFEDHPTVIQRPHGPPLAFMIADFDPALTLHKARDRREGALEVR